MLSLGFESEVLSLGYFALGFGFWGFEIWAWGPDKIGAKSLCVWGLGSQV